MPGEIYFDNNATTRVAPEVFEAMRPYLTELYGNPSSIHRFGSQVGQKIAEARAQVAALIGAADPVEVIFTSCGTEGDNAAIRGVLEARLDKRHIVTTQVEHPAVLGLCQHLEKKGYRVTWLGVNQDGMLDLDELRGALTDDTALVSIMAANNETGVLFPIEKIGVIVKDRKGWARCTSGAALPFRLLLLAGIRNVTGGRARRTWPGLSGWERLRKSLWTILPMIPSGSESCAIVLKSRCFDHAPSPE